MNEIICHTSHLPEGEELNISFMDLLLNDTWADGELCFPESLYSEIGNKNNKLVAKQNYEFLLRAAQTHPIKLIGNSNVTGQNLYDTWESFRTDCYVVGKYQQELLDTGYFNPVIETLITTASAFSNSKEAISWMEKMISHAPEYYEIDDDTRPILIYRGESTCYNQLNSFADELAKALLACRQSVEIFDVKREGHQSLPRYIGQHFKAIIGIQTYLFSVMMQDKTTNLHDLIIGPKFNMILDHPSLLKDHITNGPKDYYLLVHDRNYLNFAKKYYKNIKSCFHFSPAGIMPVAKTSDTNIEHSSRNPEKIYNLSFIGTYYNYRNILINLKSYNRNFRYLANRFLGEMKRNPNQPTETALKKVLEDYQINLSNNQFLDMLFHFRYVSFSVMYYYREKIIHTLLNAGIEVNVYGDSWNSAPFANHPCLNRHPKLDVYESLLVMQQSHICLNIMAWHKDGFTERIANTMLNYSLVVSDRSTQLEELFVDNQDLVLFDLENLNTLPATIQALLKSPEKLNSITQHGYLKATQTHLWLNRAEQFLTILNTIK